jgi:hypothetical protein
VASEPAQNNVVALCQEIKLDDPDLDSLLNTTMINKVKEFVTFNRLYVIDIKS